MKNEKIITEEEYGAATERLLFIDSERENLLSKKEYGETNTKSLSTMESFIINLNRENEQIKYLMALEKKRFLQQFSANKKLYMQLNDIIDQIIFILNNTTEKEGTIDVKDVNLLPMLTNYPSFNEETFVNLQKLAKVKMANNNLLNYCLELQNEEGKMLRIVHLYKKQLKAKEKIGKKRTKKRS